MNKYKKQDLISFIKHNAFNEDDVEKYMATENMYLTWENDNILRLKNNVLHHEKYYSAILMNKNDILKRGTNWAITTIIRDVASRLNYEVRRPKPNDHDAAYFHLGYELTPSIKLDVSETSVCLEKGWGIMFRTTHEATIVRDIVCEVVENLLKDLI